MIDIEKVFGPDYDPRGITKADIEMLALHIPIIHFCLQAHRHGSLEWEEALFMMIFNLAKEDSKKLNMILDHHAICPNPYVLKRPETI